MEARARGAALRRISPWPRLRHCVGLMSFVSQHSLFHESGQTSSARSMVHTLCPAGCSLDRPKPGPEAGFVIKPRLTEL
jgi:hypothetical protein